MARILTEVPPTSTTNTFRPEDVFATLALCRRAVGRLAAGRNLAFTTLARSLEHAADFEPFIPMRSFQELINDLAPSFLDKARTSFLSESPGRAAEGTAVAAARLVVAEVRPPALTGEFLRQQPEKRYNIGLLNDLGALRSLPPKHHVHGH